MSYWQLYYHVVWATKHRVPILTPPIEETVHGMLRRKTVALEATVFALNGPEDHIHMVVAIPPKIAVKRPEGFLAGRPGHFGAACPQFRLLKRFQNRR